MIPQKSRGVLNSKVVAVTKLMHMYKVLKGMDSADSDVKNESEPKYKQQRRRKMTITKDDAPPLSKPLYGAKK